MNASDFSSTPELGRLLETLLPRTTEPGPLQQVSASNGLGSSWEQKFVEDTASAAVSLNGLKQTLPLSDISTRTSFDARLEDSIVTSTELSVMDPLGLVAGDLSNDLSNDLNVVAAQSAVGSNSAIPFPGYVLRYDSGFSLESRPAVAQWQTQMKQRGWDIAVDGLFGPQSDRIARQFQAEKGLIADGIVGERTWQAAFDNSTITGINEPAPDIVVPAPPLGANSYPGRTLSYQPLQPLTFDAQAQAFQQRLQSLGWEIESDGLFGARTDAAARLFQTQHNLDDDGIVGPQTWAIAFGDSALTAPAQQDLNPVATTGRINAAGLELIKSFEGLRLNSYRDAVGVWTIGYGHTGTAGPGQRISYAQATNLLRSDVATFEKAVTRAVRVPITENQFAALVSFAYNVGSSALSGSTLIRRLNAGDTFGAANEFRRWNRAGGRVLAGLSRRREAERSLFLS